MESRNGGVAVDNQDKGKRLSREQKILIVDLMEMEDEENRKNCLKPLRYAISDSSLRRWKRYHEGRCAVLAYHLMLTEEHKLLFAGTPSVVWMSRRTTLKFANG